MCGFWGHFLLHFIKLFNIDFINASNSTACRIASLRFNGPACFTPNLISESIRASMNYSFAKVSLTSPEAVG